MVECVSCGKPMESGRFCLACKPDDLQPIREALEMHDSAPPEYICECEICRACGVRVRTTGAAIEWPRTLLARVDALEAEAEHQMHEAQRWAGRAEIAERQKAASTERADQLVGVWKERALVAEADLEQAFREGRYTGWDASYLHSVGKPYKSTDEAVAAWRERRAAEKRP